MRKGFKKKNVLLRSGRKDKKCTVSIHRAKHRVYRRRMLKRLQAQLN